MNFVLAKAQGKLADLEDLSEMGLDSTTIKKIGEIFASTKVGPTALEALDSQIKPLKELEEKCILGDTRTEAAQLREMKLGKPETSNSITLQLAFKPLERLIKMPETRFDAPKATAIYVTNYSTIVDEILAKRSIYKNPGFLDHQVSPGKHLRAILTNKFKKEQVGELEKKVEALFPMLRSMVTPEEENIL